jgi:hypothetical protein
VLLTSTLTGRIAPLWAVPNEEVYHTITVGGGDQGTELSNGHGIFSARYGVTFSISKHLITPAISIVTSTGAGLFDFEQPTSYDFGILYGRRMIGRVGYLYAGAGLAYARVARPQESSYSWAPWTSYKTCRVPGIVWNLAAAYKPEESYGLLFQLFGDINHEQSFYGWGVGLHLGH